MAGLTAGPIRGCLKPPLEFVSSETRWAFLLLLGLLLRGVLESLEGWFGSGLEQGSTMGLLRRAGALVAWISVVRWSPKSSVMG